MSSKEKRTIVSNNRGSVFQTSENTIVDYIATEMFLEQTGFFSPSSKRLNRIFTKEKRSRRKNPESGEYVERTLTIMAIHDLGLPVTFDQDLYRAFLKICDELFDTYGYLPEPIEVPTKKLLRYAWKSINKHQVREAKQWFQVMIGTLIKGEIYNAKTGEYEAGAGSVFSEVKMRGEALPDGNIAHNNLVWVSPWFRNNYEYGYTRHIDLHFYNRLRKPIAKALMPLLETGWFAASGGAYTKSYSSLAGDLLLTKHEFLAKIKQQLDAAHKELQRLGFLEYWEYKEMQGDILIIYKPGRKWFHDQKARLKRKKAQNGQSLSERGDEQGKAILRSSESREESRKQAALAKMREDMHRLGRDKRLG